MFPIFKPSAVADVACRLGVVLLLTGAGLVPACADKVASETKGCPCATGNVCCSSGVCAASEAGCPAATLALAEESAGTWTGYFENFNLRSGADSIRITLAVAGHDVSGQVRMGSENLEPDTLEPPTAVPGSDGGFFVDAIGGRGFEVREGFHYPATDIRWESRRLKFTIPLGAAWKARCDAQQPVTFEGQTFYCPGNFEFSSFGGCTLGVGNGSTTVPIDCHLLLGCFLDHCGCNETTCTPNGGDATIDVALRDGIGDGSIGGIDVSPINIRLTRL